MPSALNTSLQCAKRGVRGRRHLAPPTGRRLHNLSPLSIGRRLSVAASLEAKVFGSTPFLFQVGVDLFFQNFEREGAVFEDDVVEFALVELLAELLLRVCTQFLNL